MSAIPDSISEIPDKGWLERLLSPIVELRRGEATSALLMSLTMFLVLTGYYLLKTAREVFILSQGGAEVKSYASAGQALLLLILVPAYGVFASRVNRAQLVTWMPLFFVFHILVFLVLLRAGVQVGVPYFLWVGIFNVMVIAQFWAFANDLYTQEQGKRLFPLIGVGSSLGAWVGSVRAGFLLESVGPQRLLLVGAVILTGCALLSRVVDRVTTRGEADQSKKAGEKIAGTQSGFGMILSDRYLMLIAVLTVLLNVVNTSGEYLFGRYVVDTAKAMYGDGAASQAAREQFIGTTY